MKKGSVLRPSILPYFTLIAGGVGLVLRFIYLRTQMDSHGLLRANSFLNILVYILSACALAVIVLCALPLKADPRSGRKLFRPSIIPAFGCMFAGIGVLFSSLQLIMRQLDLISIVTMAMAFVAALCFGLLAFARHKGSRPHYLTHAGIIVFLMLQLICGYRVWSPQPQLSLYLFPLLASVCLVLAAYQVLCLDILKGKRWLYVLFNQAALFFCCLALTDTMGFFYLGMAIYCATNLCSVRISRSSHAPEAAEASDDTGEA